MVVVVVVVVVGGGTELEGEGQRDLCSIVVGLCSRWLALDKGSTVNNSKSNNNNRLTG